MNEGSTIKINIVDIELEGDSDCSFDYVEVTFVHPFSVVRHFLDKSKNNF